VDLNALAQREKIVEDQLAQIVQSRDLLAGEIADAGLDVFMRLVEEHRPIRPERGELSLLIVIVVVGACSLVGAALQSSGRRS
jgi:hypothetical protein